MGHSDVVKKGRVSPKEREDPSLAKKKKKLFDETKDDCHFDKDVQSVSLDHDYLEVHVTHVQPRVPKFSVSKQN